MVSPQGGPVRQLHILKQGRVRGAAAGALPGAGDLVLGIGECFPIGALTGHRAVAYSYTAEEDCFCWELPSADFDKLMARSARFRAFCTSTLSTLGGAIAPRAERGGERGRGRRHVAAAARHRDARGGVLRAGHPGA